MLLSLAFCALLQPCEQQANCPKCQGSGKVTVNFEAKCPKCNGTGHVETAEPPLVHPAPAAPPPPVCYCYPNSERTHFRPLKEIAHAVRHRNRLFLSHH